MSIQDYIAQQCEPLDLTDTFPQITQMYKDLCFTDPLTDEEMIEFSRALLRKMNQWLGRMRARLLACEDAPNMLFCLQKSYAAGTDQSVRTKEDIAFQAFKRRWIAQVSDVIKAVVFMDENTAPSYEEEY